MIDGFRALMNDRLRGSELLGWLVVVLLISGMGSGVWYLAGWHRDYGACVRSHEEPRHTDAWVEMQTHSCGENCALIIPIYHPEENWIVTVCDQYQYPEGNGPNCGRYVSANER